jgi:hypothetical protein
VPLRSATIGREMFPCRVNSLPISHGPLGEREASGMKGVGVKVGPRASVAVALAARAGAEADASGVGGGRQTVEVLVD